MANYLSFKDFKKFQISSSNFHQVKGGYSGGGGQGCERCNGTTDYCKSTDDCTEYTCDPCTYGAGKKALICGSKG